MRRLSVVLALLVATAAPNGDWAQVSALFYQSYRELHAAVP